VATEGPSPFVRDGDDLFPGPDVRFRLVGETDDFGQAIAWMEAEHARCEAPAHASRLHVSPDRCSPLAAPSAATRATSASRSARNCSNHRISTGPRMPCGRPCLDVLHVAVDAHAAGPTGRLGTGEPA
jgi:hypothetical protein